MHSPQELMAEAERRNILPPDTPNNKALLDEARRRGLLEDVISRLDMAQDAPLKKPKTVGELTGGIVSRPLITGLSAVGGTAAGAPVGPLGAAAGGGLGTLAGQFGTDLLENALREMDLLGGRNPTLGESVQRAGEEGLIDVTLAGAGAIFRPLLGTRALIGKLFGVNTTASQELQTLAKTTGVNLGAVDVGGTAPKALARVLSVFPYTGTPIVRAGGEKKKQVVRLFAEFLDSMAPTATLRNELGVDLSKAAGKRFGAFSRISARLVKNLDDAIVQAGDPAIVPTTTVKEAATEFLDRVSRGNVELLTGKDFKSAVDDKVLATIEQFAQLPNKITTSQFRARVKDLRLLMDEIQKSGGGDFAEATRFKAAFEVDFNNLDLSVVGRESAEAIQVAQKTFNEFYSKTAATFETATAKGFVRFNRNLFGPGPFKAGGLNPDEISRVALNLQSKQAIGDLEKVVGKGALKRAIREKFEVSARRAVEEIQVGNETVKALNIKTFRAEMGITGKVSTQEGLSEALKRSGIDPQDFDNFMSAAEKIETTFGPKAFIARRVTLGGARAGAALAGFGAAVAAGSGPIGQATVLTIVTMTLAARRLAQIIASPVALKNMTIALDLAVSTSARRQAFLRAARAVGLELKRRRDEEESNTQ